MSSFKYKALDPVGEPAEGVIEAENISSAINSLRDDSLVVISIRESEASWNPVTALKTLTKKRPPQLIDKVNFFQQLAMMLKGGHTLT